MRVTIDNGRARGRCVPRDGFAAIGGTSQRGEPGGVNVGAVVACWRVMFGRVRVAHGAQPGLLLAPSVTT